MRNDYCVIMTTVAHKDAARRLTAALLEARLAACIQHLPIESYYTFEGRECVEGEILLLIKTRYELYDAVENVMTAEHPYKVPELIMLPVENGLEAYLSWIDESVGGSRFTA